jgi:Domain of unknown function (DUF1825)
MVTTMSRHNYRILFVLFSAFLVPEVDTFALHPSYDKRGRCGRHAKLIVTTRPPLRRMSLAAAIITPVGPFCPFRSVSLADAHEPRGAEAMRQNAANSSPTFDGLAEEISRIQQESAIGVTPQPDRLRAAADRIERAVDQWEGLLAQQRSSPDFQTKELTKLTETHLGNHGLSVRRIVSLLRWQGGSMRALADGLPPPTPPPDLDLKAMMQEAMQDNGVSSTKDGKRPSISAMQAAQRVTACPFDPDSFGADATRQEYGQLVSDHSDLIGFGARYNEFDPLGKLSYLEQIEKIEERWDSFCARYELSNESLNAEYLKQCEQYLTSYKWTVDEFRVLLKQSHDLMKGDAESERDRIR